MRETDRQPEGESESGRVERLSNSAASRSARCIVWDLRDF